MTTTSALEIERALTRLRLGAPAALEQSVLGTLGLGLVDEYVVVESAVGDLLVAFNERGIARVSLLATFEGDPDALQESHLSLFGRRLRPARRVPRGLLGALRRGDARHLAYDLVALSPFERDVLMAALEIPAGEIRPYAWIAQRIGRPRAVRAVGSALGRNPVPVLIPCHRVVRSDGRIGNYGLGPAVKRELLAHESVDLDEVEALSRAGVRLVGSETTRIFCWPTCSSVRRVKQEHRVVFKGAEQAAAAGFRPCKRCRPSVLAS